MCLQYKGYRVQSMLAATVEDVGDWDVAGRMLATGMWRMVATGMWRMLATVLRMLATGM